MYILAITDRFAAGTGAQTTPGRRHPGSAYGHGAIPRARAHGRPTCPQAAPRPRLHARTPTANLYACTNVTGYWSDLVSDYIQNILTSITVVHPCAPVHIHLVPIASGAPSAAPFPYAHTSTPLWPLIGTLTPRTFSILSEPSVMHVLQPSNVVMAAARALWRLDPPAIERMQWQRCMRQQGRPSTEYLVDTVLRLKFISDMYFLQSRSTYQTGHRSEINLVLNHSFGPFSVSCIASIHSASSQHLQDQYRLSRRGARLARVRCSSPRTIVAVDRTNGIRRPISRTA